MIVQEIDNLLQQHRLRKTEMRREVLALFVNSTEALSSQFIETALGDVDRVTLYRTLRSFEEKGLIHKAVDGTDIAKYALCHDHCTEEHHNHNHAHFHCDQCNKTLCLDSVHLPKLKIPRGYKVSGSQLILNGLCDQCS